MCDKTRDGHQFTLCDAIPTGGKLSPGDSPLPKLHRRTPHHSSLAQRKGLLEGHGERELLCGGRTTPCHPCWSKIKVKSELKFPHSSFCAPSPSHAIFSVSESREHRGGFSGQGQGYQRTKVLSGQQQQRAVHKRSDGNHFPTDVHSYFIFSQEPVPLIQLPLQIHLQKG